MIQLYSGKSPITIEIQGRYKELCIQISNGNIIGVKKWLKKNLGQINEIIVLQVIMQNLKKTKNIQEILNLIINHGIDINSIIQKKEHNEITLLSVFVKYDNCELVARLIDICKSLNIKLPMNSAPIQLPPLYYAIEKQNIAMIQLLLENGSNPNYIDIKYASSSMQYLISLEDIDNKEIINILISYGADIHYIDKDNGVSMLYIAVQTNKLQIVSRLLEMGADPNIQEIHSGDNISPLYMAIQSGYTDIAHALIDYGADINYSSVITTESKLLTENMLYISVKTNNIEIAKRLLEQGVDLNFKTKFNNLIVMPLGLAYELQEVLDKYDTQDTQGTEPNYTNMIEILESFGAKRYICNNTDCYNDVHYTCIKCKRSQYCSKECQLANWSNHKKDCKTFCKIQKLK
jgi:ankyrin repeat protein